MKVHTERLPNAPRVFISYARSDGQTFANDLRQRLETEGIPLWQDRIGLQGGRDWWLQITEALDQVEFMVLVMTPAALRSDIVRKEWRYARQQGVCVYPIKADPHLDFQSLPHWMRSAHFYDLTQEWRKFINDLNTRCQQPRVPFMVEDLPADFVERPHEFADLISKLLDDNREEPVAITAALRGAGGYGKTTMAKAICHDPKIQDAFDDGILWITLGESPGNLVGKVEDLIYILTKEKPNLTGSNVATACLAELLADRDILLIIDDVWNAAHLKPFLQGGKRCARLITTRNHQVLPPNAQPVQVDAMRQQEAVQLLCAGLNGDTHMADNQAALRKLATRLGEWPLLLTLVNGALRKRVNEHHQLLPDALAYINKALEKRGLTAFDDKNAQDRTQAAAKTLSISLELLSEDEKARYRELAVFSEDVDIPLATLQKLWEATGKLDDFGTEELCERLHSLSLLLSFDPTSRTLRLHDVVCAYLRQEVSAELPTLHAQLLDAYQITRWTNLPQDEPYLWDHLGEHLIGAQRLEELLTTVKDLRYIAAKVHARGVRAAEADLVLCEKGNIIDPTIGVLRRKVSNVDYLLSACQMLEEVELKLLMYLVDIPELSKMCQILEQEIPRPFLTSWHVLPDRPHEVLIRTLQGHTDEVNGCAISPGGDWIVSVSDDKTLKVWDARTGLQLMTLQGHTDKVKGCAISPGGDWIVSVSDDKTLMVWDAQTGQQRMTLQGYSGAVRGCAISPGGDWIVSAFWDKTLMVWDAQTGLQRMRLEGHTGVVNGCAISPGGDWIVSASDDETIMVWDAQTGQERMRLEGHTRWVTGCAISPGGDWIVSASGDKTLKIWDAQTGQERMTLQGHTGVVNGCAISSGGDWIISASGDKTLKIWDAQTGQERMTLQGHTSGVSGHVISPSGDWIVSASWDETLKVWDTQVGQERMTLQGHTGGVNGCAISLGGDWIVSASGDKTIKVWDVKTGQECMTLQGHTGGVNGCAISPSGDWIVSASGDKTLKIWDAQTGQERMRLEGHTNGVSGCAISPSGDWIVSASRDETLKVWDAQTGQERMRLQGHAWVVNGCAISPSGDWIVSASGDKTLKIWDAQTGEERMTLQGHTWAVTGCAISPSGDWIVSASDDKMLKVWEAQTGEERMTLQGHTGGVTGCAISPSGDWIVSASYDRMLKIYV